MSTYVLKAIKTSHLLLKVVKLVQRRVSSFIMEMSFTGSKNINRVHTFTLQWYYMFIMCWLSLPVKFLVHCLIYILSNIWMIFILHYYYFSFITSLLFLYFYCHLILKLWRDVRIDTEVQYYICVVFYIVSL